jgi:peptidoglycan/xylan/chitin deacetylase (PgdA/CDA1 family)
MKIFSFRFDIDSLADIETGVPRLIDLARELDVRFTFFVNMGRSYNWRVVSGQWSVAGENTALLRHASTMRRMGLWQTLRTVFFNPDIGLSHKKTLFRLLDDGHELGLHGGMDHPLWQWRLDVLSKEELHDLLKPAYDHFERLFGKPKGLASPGFTYNRYVLELVDEYGFEYASDMEGERPFRPEGFRHMQIPVNVAGPDRMSFIEHLRGTETGKAEVEKKVVAEIAGRECAVMYGHPACEGKSKSLRDILYWVKKNGYRVVTMKKLSVL